MPELFIEGVAKEGDGVARADDGRVVFVRGALPGERVQADITEQRKSFQRAAVRSVIEAHPQRVAAACSGVAKGCGGCDLQHALPDLQAELKTRIVREAFARIGRFGADLDVSFGGGLGPNDYRTTVRCAIHGGRAGFRGHRRHDVAVAAECTIAHPLVEDLMVRGRFGAIDEVVIRASAATGERLIVGRPNVDAVVVDDDVLVVGVDQLDAGAVALMTETVAGRPWQVSAGSFFQASPRGAELLVATVGAAVEAQGSGGRMIDLYSGIGLFAGTVGRGRDVVLVEQAASSSRDAIVNLSGHDGSVLHVHSSVEDWEAVTADVVVADPARRGLGAEAAARASATGAALMVLVSCDAAAGARDARLLCDQGFELNNVAVLDLFPQTSHLETVSVLTR